MKKIKIIIKSLNELRKFVKSFFNSIPKESVICLYGEIGSGKTQFTKFFAEELGIKEDIVSPTFTKMNLYFGKKGDLVHIDTYLFKKGSNISEFLDYFENKYVVIEWPEIFEKKLNSFFVINITIKYLNNKERELEIFSKEEVSKFL